MTRILVVDDEIQIRRALDINLAPTATTSILAATGEEALTEAAAQHARPRAARPRAAGLRRRRRDPRAARLDLDPDHRAVGPRGRRQQGRRARCRRRRLRHQAVQHQRAAGPAAGHVAPAPPGAGRADRRDRRLRGRPGRPTGHPRRRDRCTSRRPNGRSSSVSCAIPAGWSPSASCCTTCGGRSTRARPTTCASTLPRSVASSSLTPASRATSSPSRASGTDSSRLDAFLTPPRPIFPFARRRPPELRFE